MQPPNSLFPNFPPIKTGNFVGTKISRFDMVKISFIESTKY
jgi:hypothetical protein